MRSIFPFGWGIRPGRRPFGAFFGLPRGYAKLVVLDALKDGPAHGYEIAKRIGEKYGGWYFPSPGLIYPTLSLLEDMEYVRVTPKEGKKVYEITEEGRKYLEAHKQELEAFSKRAVPIRHLSRIRTAQLTLELRALHQTILNPAIISSEEKAKQVRDILEEARKKIERLGG